MTRRFTPRLIPCVMLLAACLTPVAHAQFVIEDDTGDYSLKVGGQFQFRYYATYGALDAGAAVPADQSDWTIGFVTRRTKVGFSGNVKMIEYNVKAEFLPTTGGPMRLNTAWARAPISDTTTVQFGQFKLPLMREELVSSSRQLAVDRSFANEIFNQDLSQGVVFASTLDRWRLAGAISDGLRTRAIILRSPKAADIALTGRAEYRIGDADWKRYKDLTSFRGQERGVMLGGAVHWQRDGRTSTAGPNIDLTTATIDVSVEGGGWNIFVSGVWRMTQNETLDHANDFGLTAQGGFFVSDQNELFARWSTVIPDARPEDIGRDTVDDPLHTIVAGWNHYFVPESHALKFSVDVIYTVNFAMGVNDITDDIPGIGILFDSDGSQVTLRSQIQLLF